MIGFATQQLQIIYIPFEKYACDYLLLIETPFAVEKRWSEGLKNLLGEHKYVQLMLSPKQENDISEIGNAIDLKIGVLKDIFPISEIYFNIGGGQKIHTIALWESFKMQNNSTINTWAVYADQTSKKIEKWSINNPKKAIHDELSLPSLKLADMLCLYGKKVILSEKYTNDSVFMKEEHLAMWEDNDFRKFVLSLRNSKKLSDFSNEKYFVDILKEYGQGDQYGLGKFFEKLIQQKFHQMITASSQENFITQAFVNLNLSNSVVNDKNKEAEYDIVFCTEDVRMYVIDAKTYKFEKKENDARLHILRQANGVYAKFIVVLPYFTQPELFDLMGDELKQLPFTLNEMGTPFYVVSEHNTTFTIYKNGNAVSLVRPSEPDDKTKQVVCKPFHLFLKEEKLIKSEISKTKVM